MQNFCLSEASLYLRASMMITIFPVDVLCTAIIISMDQLMNKDLIYFILESHMIATNCYLK